MKKRSFVVTLGFVAVVAAVVLGLVGCSSSTTTTTAASSGSTDATGGSTATSAAPLTASLNGAGATFPGPLYLEWIGAFQKIQPGVQINYQAIGSGGGIQQFSQGTVDVGATDAPMKDSEITTAQTNNPGANVLHIPTVFGAICVTYNVPGVTTLKLDPDTMAGIFLGTIKNWNDPKLAALNPGVTFPNQAIQVVHRSDSSGTTNGFTTYLSEVSSEWSTKVGKGKEVKWPVGVGGQGNKGVAAVVQQQPGSVGYVELTYATESNLPVAEVKNKSGNFVKPSVESTSAAAKGATFPADLRLSVSNSPNPAAYPIVTATWILAWDKMKDANKAAALRAWLTWCLNDGGSIATQLGYAPLPDDLKTLALAKVSAIQ
jgi:phosphate transport system substrate-binding protein